VSTRRGRSSNQQLRDDAPEFSPRFRIRGKLGQGGMGVVFRAYDGELGHDVALKSLNRLQPTELFYLKTEFRGLADLRHPNLVALHELHFADGKCFFTMELVEGAQFLDHVLPLRSDGSARCDWQKLRDSARQLAHALTAVHAAGKLHRDVKPSNVMVTTAGRVVLLDFGLVASIDSGDGKTEADHAGIGTIGYMPPEQLRGEPLTAAADWYGFGATLYEAATGRLPFERRRGGIGNASLDDPPPRIGLFAPNIPDDLERLISALLQPSRERRPSGDDVLTSLCVDPALVTTGAALVSRPTSGAPFQGRRHELLRLGDALARLQAGHTSVVHLRGPSGIGKTELAKQFVERAAQVGALVLRGRCHPQESLPFNALDGMVDSLSQALDRMSDAEAASVLPSNADALPKLFPVLGRVEVIARALGTGAAQPATVTLRRGARALKELLATLGRRVPLVIWLDDVQWGDEDSGKLLRELMHQPDAPTVLLLLSYRTEDRTSGRTLIGLAGAVDGGEPDANQLDLPLGPLSSAETLSLLRSSLAAERHDNAELERFAKEAEGVPFFAHELGRYLALRAPGEASRASSLHLTDMLEGRIGTLSADALRVLEVVSIAGGPLEQRLVLRAAGLADAARAILTDLEGQHLVRSASLGPDRRTEIYHHRIREVVLQRIDSETRCARHHRIADVMLTTIRPNLSQVVDHYHAAGDTTTLRRYVAAAAWQASEAFAFDRAADLYQLAIDVGSSELGPTELQQRLGDALANAGRARDAGAAFERAAARGQADSAPADYLLSLRKRAAEQYLKSWQRVEAARALDAVLEPLGIAMPRTSGAALREALVNRALIAARRMRVGSLRPVVIQTLTADRLDVLLTLMKVYSMIDHAYGFAFGSRLLLEALREGDLRFIQRGLACECVAWSALLGRLPRSQADGHWRDLAHLARDHGDDYIQAVVRICAGQMHHFRGEFAQAAAELEGCLQAIRDLRAGMTVDLAVQTSFYLAALGFLGKLPEQRHLLETELLTAEARGDNYFLATCGAGHSSLAWIVTGRSDLAASWAARVLAIAPPGFSSQHYFHLVTMASLALHRGDGELAARQMEDAWPAIRSNRYLSLSLIGDDLRQLRARAAIAFASRLTSGSQAQREWLRIASAEAKQIERHGLPFARGWADLIRAGAAAVSGERAAAAAALRRALPSLEACELRFHVAAAHYALGRLEPAESAGAAHAEQWMRAASITDPDAATRLLIPGCL
jgi:tetratricopeptide (TPR) repeat protein